MRTKKVARVIDGVKCAVLTIVGALAFGFWMHSFLAGVVALCVLDPLHNIGWTIEYGDIGYPDDPKNNGGVGK